MRTVYEAANLIDAHLVRHALEGIGIPVFLAGEALAGAMGELPLFGLVRVQVPDVAWPAARAEVEALGLGEPAPAVEGADLPDGLAPHAP
ncbi:DUF2007 domain-containing protein [Lysobacter sp. GX 14042]|uniref:putative signal transducing protein n=1 Tax=Lysobacter sp. GX 14042 TaxID=2907155 RepID=UPI001F177459|nr:DUF2007 domain-containing protein [Lysobacter sp. GX 14042]MCE7031071.1 DUF2007 domain-containing protein [Lysobacter sp. GX 14042]